MSPEIEVVPGETVEVPDIQGGTVVYESDLRAAPHRNGVAAHLHGAAEVGGGDPPDGEGEDGGHLPERPKRGVAFSLVVASAYLGFGGLLVYAGAVIIKDLITRRNQK